MFHTVSYMNNTEVCVCVCVRIFIFVVFTMSTAVYVCVCAPFLNRNASTKIAAITMEMCLFSLKAYNNNSNNCRKKSGVKVAREKKEKRSWKKKIF